MGNLQKGGRSLPRLRKQAPSSKRWAIVQGLDASRSKCPETSAPQPDSSSWGGVFAPESAGRQQGGRSGALREEGVIYDSSGVPVTYLPQQGALPREKEEKDIFIWGSVQWPPHPGVCD